VQVTRLLTGRKLEPIGRDRGLSGGIELAASLLLFVLIGIGLDAWLGTAPWCAVGLSIFAGVGGFVSSWYRYKARIEEQDVDKPWNRKAARLAADAAAVNDESASPESREVA